MAKTPNRPKRRRSARAAAATAEPFKHVVLLMLENRSFDHMVGALQPVVADLDGVPAGGPPRANPDVAGTPVAQRPVAAAVVDPDPKHETPNVIDQLDDGNGRFVKDYERAYPGLSAAQKQAVMAYHPLDALTALHALGRAFAVCDRWFCSVPGPTWTNRLFAMSGTSLPRDPDRRAAGAEGAGRGPGHEEPGRRQPGRRGARPTLSCPARRPGPPEAIASLADFTPRPGRGLNLRETTLPGGNP